MVCNEALRSLAIALRGQRKIQFKSDALDDGALSLLALFAAPVGLLSGGGEARVNL